MTEEIPALENDTATESTEEFVDNSEGFAVADEEITSAEPSIEDLISRLDSVESRTTDLDDLKHNVQSQLGRVQGLQSKLDKLSANDASATYRARVEQLETSIGGLQELIMGSEFVDDQTKLNLRERQLDDRFRALEQPTDIEQEREQPSDTDVVANQMWNEATTEVVRVSQEVGYDPANIPATVWSAGLQTGSPIRAISHVSDWIREQVTESDNVSKAAQSKRAANGGSPPRAGATSNIEDLVRTYGEGKDISTAEKQRVMQHLGIRT